MGNEETAEAKPAEGGAAPTQARDPKNMGDQNRFGLLVVTVNRGVYLAPHNEKREVYVRVGWADPTTKKFLDENKVQRSGIDRSATPKWDFIFREVLVYPNVVRVEVWDTKRHLSSNGTYLGYAIVDWPFLKQWWKSGKSKLERRFEVEESAFHEKHERGKTHRSAGLYMSFEYKGEKSLSPEDEILGVTEGDVNVFANNFSTYVGNAWDELKASVEGTLQPQEKMTPLQQRLAEQEPPKGPTFLGVGKQDVTGAFKPW